MRTENSKLSLASALKPKNANLAPEDKIKIYNNNIIILFAILISFLCHFFLWMFMPAYPLHFIIIMSLLHVLMVYALFKDPENRTYIFPLVVAYIVLIDPICISLMSVTTAITTGFAFIIPLFGIFAFRSYKVSTFMLLAEMFKIYYVYRPYMLNIVNTFSKDELLDLCDKESIWLLIIIVSVYGWFSFIYAGFKANEEAIININRELEFSKYKLNQKDLFILSLSHEVRNPLNSILGNIELAYDETKEFGIKQKLFNAKICGELLLNLINNVLDTGKAENGKIEICPIECDLLSQIQKIWTPFRQMIKNKGLTPRLEIATKLPKILALDYHRLSQMLFNLVSNAIKFTEKGEVRIRVNWRPKAINDISIETEERINYIPEEGYSDLPSRRSFEGSIFSEFEALEREFPEIPSLNTEQEGELIIQVMDTGSGISKEALPNLFNKQLSSQNGKNTLGTGLGLWLTDKICEKMNSKIEVQSQIGRGTTFSLTIQTTPCKPRRPTRTISPIKGSNEQHSRIRAMVVDDMPFNADILITYLKTWKAEIAYVAPNGLAAVQFFKKCLKEGRPLDVITMDLEMPVMDGREACVEIRKIEKEKDINTSVVIIIVSGNSVVGEISKCLDPNGSIRANHFIRKPAKRKDLDIILKSITTTGKNETNKILVIDNDNFNLKLMEEMIIKVSHEPLTAQKGQQALNLFEKHGQELKLIFIECEMIDVAEKLRVYAKENAITCPVIYGITGHFEKDLEIKGKSIGIEEIIKKPISFKDLLKIIQEV